MTTNMSNSTDIPNTIAKVGGVNVPALCGVLGFYVAILIYGLWSAWHARKARKRAAAGGEDILLAGRNIGWCVGMFSMTATWVSGGHVVGTAEVVSKPGAHHGVIWAQTVIGYSLSLFLGGLFFAKKMRASGYVTMLDPFAVKYGEVMAGVLFIVAVLGETVDTAGTLSALGASLAVILNIKYDIGIIISAIIACLYTALGGLYTVVMTDVIQLSCVIVGLCLSTGFAFHHEAVTSLTETAFSGNSSWLGSIGSGAEASFYIDSMLLLLLGGIPWQCYFQRVLSAKTATRAQVMSCVGAIFSLLIGIPSALTGAIGASTNWKNTTYPGPEEFSDDQYGQMLPIVLQYLTPTWVSVIGLGAISAAVMSSADSTIMSASSMTAHNCYKPIRNACAGEASNKEIVWVTRIAVVIVGLLSTVIAIMVKSIYGLWYLCGDLVYVLLFPQLTTVLYLKKANTYGSACGLIVGMVLRFLAGDEILGLKPVLIYPMYDEATNTQNFPHKTMAMLISLFMIIVVSLVTDYLFTTNFLPPEADLFQCFTLASFERSRKLKHKYMTAGLDSNEGKAVQLHLLPEEKPEKQPDI